MKRTVAGLLSCLLQLAVVEVCTAADDGPLLPGLEPAPSVAAPNDDAREARPAAETLRGRRPALPPDDSILPRDAGGQPLAPPASEPLRLPPPPAAVDEPQPEPRRNLWQRSAEALRELATPDSDQQASDREDGRWSLFRKSQDPATESSRPAVEHRAVPAPQPATNRPTVPQPRVPWSRGPAPAARQPAAQQRSMPRYIPRQTPGIPTMRGGQPSARQPAPAQRPPAIRSANPARGRQAPSRSAAGNAPRAPWEQR